MTTATITQFHAEIASVTTSSTSTTTIDLHSLWERKNICACVRVKPPTESDASTQEDRNIIKRNEGDLNTTLALQICSRQKDISIISSSSPSPSPSTTSSTGHKNFSFDAVFGPQYGNSDLFKAVIEPLVVKFLEGYNATVLAYGQTGSGKTHTTFGTEKEPGIVISAIDFIFNSLAQKVENKEIQKWTLECSAFEIYNENCYDLLEGLSLTDERKIKVKSISGDGEAAEGEASRPTSPPLSPIPAKQHQNQKKTLSRSRSYTSSSELKEQQQSGSSTTTTEPTRPRSRSRGTGTSTSGSSGAARAAQRKPLKVRLKDSLLKTFALEGLTKVCIESVGDLLELLKFSAINRSTGVSERNNRSSRSHYILQIVFAAERAVPDATLMSLAMASSGADPESPSPIVLESSKGGTISKGRRGSIPQKGSSPSSLEVSVDVPTYSSYQIQSEFNFVDLAGSEALMKGADSTTTSETKNINTSLSKLELVINRLVAANKSGKTTTTTITTTTTATSARPTTPTKDRESFIPYRDSKLTTLLKNSLGGDSKTALIATVSCLPSQATCTERTLQFAQITRKIQNRAQVVVAKRQASLLKDEQLLQVKKAIELLHGYSSAQMKKMEEDLEKWKHKANGLEEEKEDLMRQLADLNTTLRRLRLEGIEKDAQISTFMQQLQDSESLLTSARALQEESEKRRKALEEEKDSNIRHALSDFESKLTQQLDMARESQKQMTEELLKATHALAEKEAEIEVTKSNSASELTTLRDMLERERAINSKELQTIGEMHAAQIQSLESKNESEVKEIKRSHALELLKMQTDFELEKGTIVMEIEGERDLMKQEMYELTSKHQDALEQLEKDHKIEIEALKQENRILLQQSDETQLEIRGLRDKLEKEQIVQQRLAVKAHADFEQMVEVVEKEQQAIAQRQIELLRIQHTKEITALQSLHVELQTLLEVKGQTIKDLTEAVQTAKQLAGSLELSLEQNREHCAQLALEEKAREEALRAEIVALGKQRGEEKAREEALRAEIVALGKQRSEDIAKVEARLSEAHRTLVTQREEWGCAMDQASLLEEVKIQELTLKFNEKLRELREMTMENKVLLEDKTHLAKKLKEREEEGKTLYAEKARLEEELRKAKLKAERDREETEKLSLKLASEVKKRERKEEEQKREQEREQVKVEMETEYFTLPSAIIVREGTGTGTFEGGNGFSDETSQRVSEQQMGTKIQISVPSRPSSSSSSSSSSHFVVATPSSSSSSSSHLVVTAPPKRSEYNNSISRPRSHSLGSTQQYFRLYRTRGKEEDNKDTTAKWKQRYKQTRKKFQHYVGRA